VPAGYDRQADDVGETGPSDLEKAADDDGEDDAHAFLEQHGFVVGYQRLWAKGIAKDADGEPNFDAAQEIVLFLYVFRDDAGAKATLDRYVGFVEEGIDGEGHPFDVPEIAGARGWAGGSDDDGQASLVMFTKGRYLVQVVRAGSGADADVDLVRSLARDQYGRL
jgi:hypothetical protein